MSEQQQEVLDQQAQQTNNVAKPVVEKKILCKLVVDVLLEVVVIQRDHTMQHTHVITS